MKKINKKSIYNVNYGLKKHKKIRYFIIKCFGRVKETGLSTLFLQSKYKSKIYYLSLII